jgi:hypothetical protein
LRIISNAHPPSCLRWNRGACLFLARRSCVDTWKSGTSSSRFQGYSRCPFFRDINPSSKRGLLRMTSESVAGILAAIIASVVLVVAIAYGPIGQFGKPAKQAQQPAQAVPAAPVLRGPVIKDVPN